MGDGGPLEEMEEDDGDGGQDLGKQYDQTVWRQCVDYLLILKVYIRALYTTLCNVCFFAPKGRGKKRIKEGV